SSMPSTRSSGVRANSTTVTSRPRPRSDAATSLPMNPAPTTTAFAARFAAALIRSASAAVLSSSTPGRSTPGRGSLRLRQPVAISAASNAIRSPSARTTTRSAVSTRSTRVPNRVSTSFSSQNAGGRIQPRSKGCSSRRYSLESGGRSYGGRGSSPTSTSRPSNPSERSVAAAVAPARLAPTTTKVGIGRSNPDASAPIPPSSRLLQRDLELPGLLACLEDVDRFGRRSLHDLAGHDVELAAVAGALDHGAVQLSLRQRALLMCADVVKRMKVPAHVGDRDRAVADRERAHLAVGDLAGLADLHPVRHLRILPSSQCRRRF